MSWPPYETHSAVSFGSFEFPLTWKCCKHAATRRAIWMAWPVTWNWT